MVNIDLPRLGSALTPSWLSGLLTLVIALTIVSGTVVTVRYRDSFELWREAHSSQSQPQEYDYGALDDNFSKSQLISDIPLLIFWSGVGLIIYYFTMSLFKLYRRAVDFEHQLDYVNADRNRLVKAAATKAAFRLAVIVIWFLCLRFTQHVLLPYVIALSYTGSGSLYLNWLQNTAYLSAATALAALTLHVHVVLLRLAFLRTRLFSAV
jgi:ABC-type multidrug transport system permease subunit